MRTLRTAPTISMAALWLALAAPVSAQVPDHLACYKVKDPQPKALYTADVGGLVQHSGCLVKVPAVMACVPSTQTNVQPPPPSTGGIGTPNAFGCYKVKCPKAVLPTFQLDDQFGSRVVTARTSKVVCAPVTPTTTTTVSTTTSTTATTTTLPGQLCDLPGSIQYTSNGVVTVPGGATHPDLSFVQLPAGFCAHYFGNVGNARQIRVAPSGELFVASPTTLSTDGGPDGLAAMVVLPDDDQDGIADTTLTFQSGLPSTHGLTFTNGYLYYQDGIDIRRVPYAPGDRTPSAASELVATIDGYVSGLNWPKPLDVADDGTIYVGNGGDAFETCDPMGSLHGGILSLDSLHGTPVAKGMFYPKALRCARGTGHCFAVDTSKQYSAMTGGRDKLLTFQTGDDFGYACCASANVPYTDVTPTPDCSGVAKELKSTGVDERPSGLDFSPASWGTTFGNAALIAIHGASGSWAGARLVLVRPDAMSGLPTGLATDFATGWDDGTLSHGQPADVTFGPDGRMYVANDRNGDIFWVAPIQ